MSYLLSGLDLVVNNTTSIVVNTNQTTVQGDIATSENVIAVGSTYNRFSVPDNAAAATIKSTSKALSLTGLTAKAVNTTQVPISTTVEGNGLKNLLTSYYEDITYTPQLLTCVGVNSTSTTIGDLSSSNFTITNNNLATVSTFGPFLLSSFAYDSVLFNGTTQSLTTTVTTSSPLDLATGAGNWTIEGWFYVTSIAAGSRSVLWKPSGGSNPAYAFWISAATPQWIIGDGAGGGNIFNLAVITANTWYHFALVRIGNTLTPYMNGVAQTAQTITTTMGNGAASTTLYIGAASDGRYFPGYISNVRIVKGTAIYKGNFLPPTQNFSAASITNITTKVSATTATTTKSTYEPLKINLYNNLKYSAPTGQQETYDPDLVGNSIINSYVVGNVSNKHIKSDTEIVNVFLSPEFYINGPDAPIVLSTEGRGEITTQITGALVFNNDLSAISYAGNPGAFNITADFTVEFWLKPTNWGQNVVKRIMGNYTSGGSGGWGIHRSDQSGNRYRCLVAYIGGFSEFSTLGEADNDVWQHWALVRSGSILSWWKNGVLDSSVAITRATNLDITDFASPFTLGTGQVANFYNRSSEDFQISNLRIVKGTALYASTFTPQVPLPVVANTTFLLPVADSATQLLETISGSTLTSNSVEFTNLGPGINTSTTTLITPVRGGGSFNGTTATLTSPGNSPFNLTTNDFTLETWIYYLGTAAAFTIMGQQGGPSPNRGWLWTMGTGGDLAFGWSIAGNGTISSGGAYYSTAVAPLNQWNHIAFVRKATTYTFYINGVAAGSGTMSGAVNFVGPFGIGYTPNETTSGQSYFNGSMSNIRIVNGVAVYTGNFTVPTKPLAKEQNAGTNIEAITTQTVLLTLQNPLTLVDNSNSANTISNVGGVTIASTNSPVWANYPAPLATGGFKFSGGASEYYTLPALNTVFQFGTGDFTIELWVYITKGQTGYIYDTRPTTTQGAYATLYYSHTNGWISYDTDSSSRLTALVSLNRWYHVAVCKINSTTKLYLNGTDSGSSYSSGSSYLTSSSPTNLGASTYTTGAAPFAGQISNLRVVKGLGVYTGNFTVPTSPLTKTQTSSTNISAIVGGFTSLLTAQDGTKLDYSDNAATISSSVNSVTPSVLYGPVLGTVSTAATVNSSPGAYVSTPPINTTNIEYIDYRTDPRSVNKRVKNLIVGTTGVLEELQSWS